MYEEFLASLIELAQILPNLRKHGNEIVELEICCQIAEIKNKLEIKIKSTINNSSSFFALINNVVERHYVDKVL